MIRMMLSPEQAPPSSIAVAWITALRLNWSNVTESRSFSPRHMVTNGLSGGADSNASTSVRDAPGLEVKVDKRRLLPAADNHENKAGAVIKRGSQPDDSTDNRLVIESAKH